MMKGLPHLDLKSNQNVSLQNYGANRKEKCKVFTFVLEARPVNIIPSRVAELTPEQLTVFHKFQEIAKAHPVPHYQDSDHLRFCRARNFDLAKTNELWTAFVRWRKDNDVDNIQVRRIFLSRNRLT